MLFRISVGISFRTSLRSLARKPGYALCSIALLALGIGTTTGIFRAVDAVLFRPIVAPEPERLVRILGSDEQHTKILGSSSAPVFRDYLEASTSISGLAAYHDDTTIHAAFPSVGRTAGRTAGGTAGGAAQAERVSAGIASGDYFALFGASAAHGRLLGPQDDRVDAPPVAVISHPAFRRRFGGDPAAVGSTIMVNGRAVEVVGVLARGFRGANLLSPAQELWLPLAQTDLVSPEWASEKLLDNRNISWLDIIGRLAPGATMASAQAELDAVAAHRAQGQTEEARDPWPGLHSAVDLALDWGTEQTERRVAVLLGGLAAMLFLAAVANAAGLGLARSLARRRELAVRGAIGAGRGRIVAEVAAECALLALGAALLAPYVAYATLALLRARSAGLALPLDHAADAFDVRTLAVAALVAGVATLLFAAAPAMASGRLNLTRSLKSDSGSVALGERAPRYRLRRLLLAFQTAVAMLLLVGAALFLRTLERVTSVPLGFDKEGVVLASLDFGKRAPGGEPATAAFARVVERLASAPGVRSAAAASHVPVFRWGMRMTVRPEGYTHAPDEDEGVNLAVLSPGFFETLRIPLAAGRDFEARDSKDAAKVAIVNQAFVRKYFPDGVGIGKRLFDSGGRQPWQATIVGVAGDVRERSLRGEIEPLFYLPMAQSGRARNFVVARTEPGAETAVLAALRAAVAEVDPQVPVHLPRTLAAHVDEALATERTLAGLITVAAALTLALVVAGLAAITAVALRARTRELGIRSALGARAVELARAVGSEAAVVTAVGAAVGGGVAVYASRFVDALLFGVERLDPSSYLGAGLALLASAALAVLPFARRAARVDPAAALRCE